MKRILCAVDASPRAAKLVTAAIDLANRTGAKLILFRGVGLPPEIPYDLYMGGAASVTELLVAQAQSDLTTIAARIPPNILETTAVDIGVPWEAICRAATKFEAELIVVGSHGYSGLDHLLGTTAAKVVNHADRCVLVVRGDSPFA